MNRLRTALVIGTLASLALAASPAFASSDDAPTQKPDKKVRRIVIRTGSGSFLGVGVADVDADRAKELGLKEEYGVEVKSVVDDSAAAQAGVKEGDVVLEYNGQRLESSAQFVRMVRETPAGRQVKLLVSRDGRTMTLTPTLATRKPHVFRWQGNGDDDVEIDSDTPEPPDAPEAPGEFKFEMPEINIPEIHIPDIPATAFMWNTPRLGVETEAVQGQLAEFFGVKKGLLVRSVISGSAAEKAGLKAGDVIVKVGSTEISRQGEISEALRAIEAGKNFQISIVRNKKEMSLTGKLDEKKSTLHPKMGHPRAKIVSIPSGDEL